VDDPHVARLLEGVAFLGARVQHRLDDEFPELTDALLGVLYPHYLAPFPSCAIARFVCQPDLMGPSRLPAGLALDTEPVRNEPCRFRTASPVTLWPVEIEAVRLSGLPLAAPVNPRAPGAVAVLRISLRCAGQATLSELGLDKLRVFLRGASNVVLPLYELICNNTVGVACADGPADTAPVPLDKAAISPAGFAPEDALIPWPARGFSGLRLLSEYFAFPEKFLFLDIAGLEAKTLVNAGAAMDVFIYFDRAVPALERVVDAGTLALGCVPIVNLFPQRCEPIKLTHTDTEYRVVPDTRRPSSIEVWSVDRVRETRPNGVQRPWRPFYRLTHGDPEAGVSGGFYHLSRRDSSAALGGSEVYLGAHDPDFDPDEPADAVLSVDATCSNRDLPADLPFGGGHPALRLIEGAPGVIRAECITAPTPTQRMRLRERGFWRLVSHLSIGHFAITGGAAGAAALREILRLYDLRESPESRAAIEGLVGVRTRPGTARVPGARPGAFCRGLDVTLEFDPRVWESGGLYLLASVLDRFLGLHATINSFTRTTAVLRGRPGRAGSWPARAGDRPLL
jgi:type VI secretion system protein ImpG